MPLKGYFFAKTYIAYILDFDSHLLFQNVDKNSNAKDFPYTMKAIGLAIKSKH